jgi:hypothetical protein
MKRFKIVGLCLMAVFALSAVVASSASAALEPEFTGSFPNNFTSLALGSSELKAPGLTVTCAHLSNSGVITGAKMGSVDVTFTGCLLSNTFPCNSAGAASEEIRTTLLLMTPGYIKKGAPTEVGVQLEPAAAGGAFTAFTCHIIIGEEPEQTVSAEVKGAVIGNITPLKTQTLEFELSFSEGAGSVQSVAKFEGEKAKEDHLLEVFLNGETKAVKGVEVTQDMIFTEKDTEIMA